MTLVPYALKQVRPWVGPITSEKAPTYGDTVSFRSLIEITSRQQHAQRTLLDWLRVEYGIEKPSNKHEAKS
jgi:hypothetical protein